MSCKHEANVWTYMVYVYRTIHLCIDYMYVCMCFIPVGHMAFIHVTVFVYILTLLSYKHVWGMSTLLDVRSLT